MTITVGITGGIGSGKSTVCEIFKILGIPIFEADKVAKNLMNENSVIRQNLVDWFGNEIYSGNQLNRKLLAGLIFNNNTLLTNVNNLVHPIVREEFEKWKNKQETAYSVYEAAILFESGFYKLMDFTVLIIAPEQIRINRVMKRDNLSLEQVTARINNQWPDDEKRKLATTVIINDNKNLIIPQIIEIDKKLKRDGKIW
jgi:dephospho-CoA kinase